MEVSPLIVVVIFIVFGILISIYARSRKQQVDIRYFIIGLFFMLMGQIIYVVSPLIEDLTDQFLVLQFGGVFLSFGLIFIFLHYETLVSSRPNYSLLIIQWIIATACLVSWLVLPFQAYILNEPLVLETIYSTPYLLMTPSINQFTSFMTNFLLTFQYLLAIGRGISILSKVYKTTLNNSVNMERIALVILFIYRIILTIPYTFPLGDYHENITNIAHILAIIGLLMMQFNYLVHPGYLYLLPFPIHSIMIYTSNGLLIYDRIVNVQKIQMEDVGTLMSGALTAIQMMIQEVLGKGTNLHFLDTNNYKIFFAPLPQEKGVFAIITEQETKIFEKSIERFTQNFPASILKYITPKGLETTIVMHQEIDSLIKIYFPYVLFK